MRPDQGEGDDSGIHQRPDWRLHPRPSFTCGQFKQEGEDAFGGDCGEGTGVGVLHRVYVECYVEFKLQFQRLLLFLNIQVL